MEMRVTMYMVAITLFIACPLHIYLLCYCINTYLYIPVMPENGLVCDSDFTVIMISLILVSITVWIHSTPCFH